MFSFLSPDTWSRIHDLILLYSPIGIIGAWRWGVWLWQKLFSFRYHATPVPRGFSDTRPTFSVVTPVYNEDPELFREALASWERNGADEIIAVIDATDTSCIRVFEEFGRGYPGARLVVTDVPGKRPALAKGARLARGEIVALVDSDTLWDDNIGEKMLVPFRDPKVGGVSTRQAILDPRTIAERLFAIRLNLRYLHEFPYLAAVGDVLICLSGRTAVYRRSALLPLLDDLVNEKFLGEPCISGDDKRLTSLLQAKGWKTRFQQDAIVRTTGMPGLPAFFRQNLRWSRNSWRTDLKTLFSLWPWKREPLFAYHLVDRAVSAFTLLLGPIYFGVAIAFRHYEVAALLALWWIASRTIKLFPHLRRHPGDIFMVPVFTVAQYILAVIKIYALFTLDYQSWITRWHQARIRTLSFFRLLPSRVATLAVIGGIAFGITQHELSVARALELKREQNAIPYTADFSSFGLDAKLADFWKEREAHRVGTYVTRLGDTPQLLTRKWNLTPEQSQTVFAGYPSYVWLRPNTTLTIPVEYLRNTLSPTSYPSINNFPSIAFDPTINAVRVKGKGSIVTVPQIATALRAQGRGNLLESTAPKEWLLRGDLYVSEGVTLIVDGNEVEWLKLLSTTGENFAYLRSYNGSMLIRDTKITSWDETKNAPDTDYSDGRAYILAQTNGRMDVIDSEIAYLGYPRDVELRQRKRVGGVYGLSWKIPNGTFNRNLLTGNVTGNRIHDNYYGLYTFGATGMIIRDNELYDNVQYGIDPHDDSNNLLIEDNFAHNNGNHGIIVSKRVNYSDIRNNTSAGNRLHGLMLDRQSNYNLVENNIASNNVNGLAIYDSHQNLVRGNTFLGNRFGIRANVDSSGNRFEGNGIRGSEKGIFLYGGATGNVVIDNRITGNTQGVAIKEATKNYVLQPLASSSNSMNFKLDERAKTENYIKDPGTGTPFSFLFP